MTPYLFTKFAISTGMLVFCVVLHCAGLFSLNKAMQTEANLERLRRMTALSLRGSLFTLVIVLALIAVHAIEIWAYAILYLGIGAISGLEDSLYYSTISYSTVGYNDELIHQDWKLLGAFESIVGMILIGWSTAFFFRMLGRIDGN